MAQIPQHFIEKIRKFRMTQIPQHLIEKIKRQIEWTDKYNLEIIRAAVKIEILLKRGIKNRFHTNISVEKIVGDSFEKLINLAYALGILQQKTYESLHSFRKLRNQMAHQESRDVLIEDIRSITLFIGDQDGMLFNELRPRIELHKMAVELLVKQVEAEVFA